MGDSFVGQRTGTLLESILTSGRGRRGIGHGRRLSLGYGSIPTERRAPGQPAGRRVAIHIFEGT